MVKGRRRAYKPGPETAQPRERLRVLIEQGSQYMIPPDYVARARPDFFTEAYREKVVKYINELAEDFGLQVQTGGIACNYFDRYIPIALRKGPMSKRQMQMIASTCMLISAKFFDRKLPPISELVILHNHTVTPEQFMHQEMVILEALEWKLHVILPHALIEPLRACLPDAPADQAINDRMMFFIDLSVYGYELLRYTPAEILGGSMLAAWKFSNESVACDYFLPAMADACATCEDSLQRCANELVRYYQVCFLDAPKMIPQPIEPGTEGPVQLVEFTDLFEVPHEPSAAPKIKRNDSTDTQIGEMEGAGASTDERVPASVPATEDHLMQPADRRGAYPLPVPFPVDITAPIINGHDSPLTTDEHMFAPVEAMADDVLACDEERSDTPTEIFTKNFGKEPARAKAAEAASGPSAAAVKKLDMGRAASNNSSGGSSQGSLKRPRATSPPS